MFRRNDSHPCIACNGAHKVYVCIRHRTSLSFFQTFDVRKYYLLNTAKSNLGQLEEYYIFHT